MKNPRIHAVLNCCSHRRFGCNFVAFGDVNSRGQSPAGKTEQQNPKTESLVKPTVLHTERTAANPSAVTIAPFADAAAQNSLLRNDLIWEFGRKSQRGWHLYDLLIGKTLNISHNASSLVISQPRLPVGRSRRV